MGVYSADHFYLRDPASIYSTPFFETLEEKEHQLFHTVEKGHLVGSLPKTDCHSLDASPMLHPAETS